MSFLDFLKDTFEKSQERKRADREMMDRIRLEADVQARITFEKEARGHALEMAIGKAKKEAASKTGYQKFKAQNRLRNLNNPKSPQGALGRMREYTQRNLAKRDENLERTARLRSMTKEEKESGGGRKPFSPSRLQTPQGFGRKY